MKNRKISDIAFYWGFQDSAHFNKRFKQQYAMSPSAFREKMNEEGGWGQTSKEDGVQSNLTQLTDNTDNPS